MRRPKIRAETTRPPPIAGFAINGRPPVRTLELGHTRLEFKKALCSSYPLLDGIQNGAEEIFPDPFVGDFGKQYESSPKTVERQMIAMATESVG